MNWLRWHAFRFLSHIGWMICPEPHRSRLQSVLPQWDDLEPQLAAMLEDELSCASEGRWPDSRSTI